MFKKIIQSLVTKAAVAFINFCILIISSKYLGINSRGEISIFILNIAIIQAINEIYTGYSIIHFIPKFNLKKIILNGFIYTLIFCSLSNFIVVFFNKQVLGYEWLGYAVSLFIIWNTFNCVIILGKQKIATYNFLSFLQPLLLLIGIIFYVFVLKVCTFQSYIFPLMLSFAGATVLSSLVVFKNVNVSISLKVSPYELKPILINGFLFQANVLMYLFCNRYSYYFLPTTAKVGLYASASVLIESVLIVVNGIAPVLISRAANRGNTEETASLALSLSKLSFVFSCLVMVIVFAIPESFYVYLLGTEFTGIKQLMLVYAPGILLVSFFATLSNYFSALGKQKIIFYCYAFGFIFTILFAPIFVKYYDTKGAAYSAMCSYFIITIATCITFIRSNKLSLRQFFSIRHDYQILKQLSFLKN